MKENGSEEMEEVKRDEGIGVYKRKEARRRKMAGVLGGGGV